MPRICDIYDVVNAAAPFESQLDFDNSGLLVGEAAEPVTRVLLCLDITPAVIQEARELNVNLIISHHPVIFDPLRRLTGREPAFLLAKYGIAALCCHTNLDLSPVCGVNVALGNRLGLRSIHLEDAFGPGNILFSGELERELSPEGFAALVKNRLKLTALTYIPGDSPVKRVFFCSGSGGEQLQYAVIRDADAFLTGEMKHHEALAARETGLTVAVAGHYETEIVFAEYLAAYLGKRFPGTGFLVSRGERPVYQIL